MMRVTSRGVPKPLSEYETTLTARKHRAHPAPDPDAAIEGVRGGRVRRIVFEDEAEPEPEPEPTPEPRPEPKESLRFQEVRERQYAPRHRADIREIERDVDRIIGRTYAPSVPERAIRRERTIYETSGGRVSEEVRETREGRSRAYYIANRDGPVTKERRFSAADVDRIIADRPAEREVIRETYRETRRVQEAEHERPKARRTARRKRKRSKRGKIEPAPEQTPEYQPQCEAVTSNGKQCRNSAKQDSPYCGSHQGYEPLSMKQIMARQDTGPRVKNALDTLPASGSRGTKDGYQAQCAALTASGKQCRNSSRAGSMYCASHRNFRAGAVSGSMDTKPRVAKAEDTKPRVSKPAVSTGRGKAGAGKTGSRKDKATRKSTATAGKRAGKTAKAGKTGGKAAKKTSRAGKAAKKGGKKVAGTAAAAKTSGRTAGKAGRKAAKKGTKAAKVGKKAGKKAAKTGGKARKQAAKAGRAAKKAGKRSSARTPARPAVGRKAPKSSRKATKSSRKASKSGRKSAPGKRSTKRTRKT